MEPQGNTCYTVVNNMEGLNDRSLVLFYKSSSVKENLNVKQL